jgi:hypothetical protein
MDERRMLLDGFGFRRDRTKAAVAADGFAGRELRALLSDARGQLLLVTDLSPLRGRRLL